MKWWMVALGMAMSVSAIGCTTTKQYQKQDGAAVLLEERVVRLEERVVAMEDEQRRSSEASWQTQDADEARDEAFVIEPVPSASAAGRVATSDEFVKPSSRQIQQALHKAGYYHGAVDGKIGPKTKQAIKQFQREHGLVADGKVGRATWGVLGKYLEG